MGNISEKEEKMRTEGLYPVHAELFSYYTHGKGPASNSRVRHDTKSMLCAESRDLKSDHVTFFLLQSLSWGVEWREKQELGPETVFPGRCGRAGWTVG